MPDGERARAQETVVGRPEQMPTDAGEVLNEAVHRQEALGVGNLEPLHLRFTSPRGLMRHFRPVVRVSRRVVHDQRHHGTVSRRVTAEFVGDHTPQRAALPLQELPPFR